MRSFAEALRRGCQVELDIDPGEILGGLQPRNVDNTLTAGIYLADSLENGAGFATELTDPARLRDILEKVVHNLGLHWHRPEHADCDTSCTDCLRSYDNRFYHAHLNWRLALDVAELALGQGLDLTRWSTMSTVAATQFVRTYAPAL